MTPAARIAATIALLADILDFARPADMVVSEYLRQRRYIGSKDRRAILELGYACLRAHARLGWWLSHLGATSEEGDAEARLRVIAALSLVEDLTPQRIAKLFDGGKFHPAALTAAERRFLGSLKGRTLEHPHMPEAVRLEIPEWLLDAFRRAFPDSFESEVLALSQQAPTDLRVNRLKADREGAMASLKAETLNPEPTAMSPIGLRLQQRAALSASRAFLDGLVEVQDESSQIAALLVEAAPGMRVVDFCAGAGGKTMALAAEMQNKGHILALDVLKGRLDRAGVRLRRAGVHNVERRQIRDHQDKWIKRHAGRFDRVLIDAPCTGTGAWRRNPDARWRLSAQDLDSLTGLQSAILDSAARLTAPGGRLIYATCSLLPQEDEDQVASFLDRRSDFQLLPVAELWSNRLLGACPSQEDCLKLTPYRNRTDGFFVAVFLRANT